jgi:hypothetical protein
MHEDSFALFSAVHDSFGSLLECQCVVRPVSQRHLNYLFSINKVRINGLVISHLCGFTTIPFTPAIILLGILYLINPHTSDGQHKEPCHHQQC